MIIIPYHVDVPMRRWPFANWGMIGAIVVVSLLFFKEIIATGGRGPVAEDSLLFQMILTDWRPVSLLGHMFLHAGFMHLAGNMLFLWVFGNAVCAKLSNVAYPFVFLGLGVAAAAGHLLMSDAPAVGASGAVNGVVGMFVVLYPLNKVSCGYFFWIFYFFRIGSFSVSSFWIVLLWVAFDLLGLFLGLSGVAYAAHLAGFATGFVFMALLLKTGIVKLDPGEVTLLDMLGMGPSGRKAVPRGKARIFPPSGPAARPAAYPTSTVSRYAPPEPSPEPTSRPAYRPGAPPLGDAKLHLRCPCGRQLLVPAAYAGRRGKCPGCGRVLVIPAPPD